jgi:Fur family ferric uptake transcriptional regulator
MDQVAVRLKQLRECISKEGLKQSRQREIIAEVFFGSEGHISVDEVLQRVRKVDPRVSQATVYRTMKLLTEFGLAEARHFLEGHTLYEPSGEGKEHHDHLICTGCGQIVEFVDERIEELQDEVARKHGFEVVKHKMELYGLCDKCRTSEGSLNV